MGVAIALISTWLAGFNAQDLPYTVVLVLAIALIGLILGAGAAAWAWLGGLAVLSALLVATDDPITSGDAVRLTTFILGSPVVVVLVRRVEVVREEADRALAGSRHAQDAAAIERERLEEARREVDQALIAAERERARLE